MASNLDNIARSFDECTDLFFALGETARQQIIMLLAEVEYLNVGQLTERLPLSRPAISHHLKVLRQAGLVTVQKRGTEALYSLAMDDALAVLKRFVKEVEDCI
jgi:DNA-binding transcriptional ArsR family regulator